MHAADADVALAVARRSAGDERVRHDHRARRVLREVRAHPVERCPEHGGVAALDTEPDVDEVGVEVGHGVDVHGAVRVGQRDRTVDVVDARAHVHPGRLGELGTESQPGGRVVVAGEDHHRDAGGGEAGEAARGQPDRVDGRDRPVEDVARHEDGVDLAAHRLGEQPVEEGLLVGGEVHAVERPAQVPVRGVEQPHGSTVRRTSDKAAAPHRSSRCPVVRGRVCRPPTGPTRRP